MAVPGAFGEVFGAPPGRAWGKRGHETGHGEAARGFAAGRVCAMHVGMIR